MRSFWADPYLWVHLAGLAAVPIFLELCLIGLAVGEPLLPIWMELLVVGAIGVIPVLWMQWQRPFSIFSLVLLALKPEQLTADQRRILRLFKSPIERALAILATILLLIVLWQLHQLAPLAVGVASRLPIDRSSGLLLAAIAFLFSNLFFQVPVSVVRVLLTPEAQFVTTEPYPVERITQDFTLLGLRVQQLLPALIAAPKPPAPTVSPPPPAPLVPPPVPPDSPPADAPIAQPEEAEELEMQDEDGWEEPDQVFQDTDQSEQQDDLGDPTDQAAPDSPIAAVEADEPEIVPDTAAPDTAAETAVEIVEVELIEADDIEPSSAVELETAIITEEAIEPEITEPEIAVEIIEIELTDDVEPDSAAASEATIVPDLTADFEPDEPSLSDEPSDRPPE